MGRKDFMQDVKRLKEYFNGLNSKSAALVKGFDFQDPELSFTFQYDRGRSFTVQVFVNDDLSSYPEKFSGFVYVQGASDNNREINDAAALLQAASIADKAVCEIVATITQQLCDHFRIPVPRELLLNALERHGGPAPVVAPPPQNLTGKSVAPIVKTPGMLLKRDLEELKHWRYHGELLCADEIGFKVSISMPVSRLGLSLEACEAWNLDPNRYIVCTMQFSPKYIDLEGAIANARQTKGYLIKEGGYALVKEELKKQFPVMQYTVLTSAQERGVPSQAHHKDDNLESDHFVLSWTLTELLRSKFFDMLCDRMWFGIGWGGAEYADLRRNKDLDFGFLNNEESLYSGQIDECLIIDREQHGQLLYLEAEQNEEASAAKNQNFLLLILRFLRRRILLSTKYCLTCHYPHTESVSSIRPFVCGTALCQHQSLVGLGNLFEAVLVNSPVVVDLLISLCFVAIQSHNLSPFPSRAIGVTTTTKCDIQSTLAVKWSGNQGVIGELRENDQYIVQGWSTFNTNEIMVNDVLEVYIKETGSVVSANRSNQGTSVRVLEVTPNYLVTDFPIIISVSAAPHKPSSLPFRTYRRTECNFLNQDDQPNYQLLQSVIDCLPGVMNMVQYAKKKCLKAELDKLNILCFPLLSWIISSNRTHLRLMNSDDEKVQFGGDTGNYSNWKQFVMIMSSPEKEETFQREKARLRNERAGQTLGELYAFHGSPLQNWHSIIRTSLNWKKVVHGRAYGDGVYLSLQAATSATYAGQAYHRHDTGVWKSSMLIVQKCMALSEVVNRPNEFTSTNPHLVIKDESWITTRYLFVECQRDPIDTIGEVEDDDFSLPYSMSSSVTPSSSLRYTPKAIPSFLNNIWQRSNRDRLVEFIKLDNNYTPTWLNNQALQIPKRDFSIVAETFNDSSSGLGPFIYHFKANDEIKGIPQNIHENSLYDDGDDDVFEDDDEDIIDDDEDEFEKTQSKGKSRAESDEEDEDMTDEQGEDYMDYDDDDDDAFNFQEAAPKKPEYEEIDADGFDPSLLPLPAESSKTATQRICKELRQIVQKQSSPSNDLAFYLNTDKLISMYQWVVQLGDFDPSLPLAQDMKKYKVKFIDMEVRFAPDYPYVPPYLRIIRPRLLRFMEGGGGHVTVGGSICMDLLTLGNNSESGWSSVYTMEAVLLQIKVALSSLEPNPARLDPRRWNSEYNPSEAMDAYIRVANQHGWKVPPQWSTLFGRF